jgi:hypothetical protein
MTRTRKPRARGDRNFVVQRPIIKLAISSMSKRSAIKLQIKSKTDGQVYLKASASGAKCENVLGG